MTEISVVNVNISIKFLKHTISSSFIIPITLPRVKYAASVYLNKSGNMRVLCVRMWMPFLVAMVVYCFGIWKYGYNSTQLYASPHDKWQTTLSINICCAYILWKETYNELYAVCFLFVAIYFVSHFCGYGHAILMKQATFALPFFFAPDIFISKEYMN